MLKSNYYVNNTCQQWILFKELINHNEKSDFYVGALWWRSALYIAQIDSYVGYREKKFGLLLVSPVSLETKIKNSVHQRVNNFLFGILTISHEKKCDDEVFKKYFQTKLTVCLKFHTFTFHILAIVKVKFDNFETFLEQCS